MSKRLTLVLGGARAGKSSYAWQLAARGGRSLFVATAEARDEEMAARIQAHRDSRPGDQDTLEEPVDLVGALSTRLHGYDILLLDCLTMWVSNLLLRCPEPGAAGEDIQSRTRRLLELYRKADASWIVVSNEVGLGVVPPTRLGRLFRDELGRANQLFASEADDVVLLAAGLPLALKGRAAAI